MLQSILNSLSGILLVAGTSIGAGMLALPVITGLAGFFPAILISFLCCLFMMATGLLFLEATLWMDEGANVLSMSERFLGRWGKWIGGCSFLFLYYCFEVSYSDGGSPLFSLLIYQIFGVHISGFLSNLLFALFFGVFVFFGAASVNKLNWLLMTGLFLTYSFLLILGSKEINAALLQRADWSVSLLAAPVLFSAYGYHNLLPSMATYMRRNALQLRIAIIGGTIISFVIYSLWQWLIIGTLSLSQIQSANLRGEPITQTFQELVNHPYLGILSEFFGFFALVTSFLGVSLSMVDFLADGLKVQRHGRMRVWLCLAVFLPPALFAYANPGIFIEAIGIAGGFGEAILNGLFPIAMVWVGRYHLGLSSDHPLFGGRLMLVLLSLITFSIMSIEAWHLYYD